ncbi:MAG: redoxin domain-containing protein [Nitrososphaerota archaeon]|nr:redoxin domain-containing protein [Nitrososphaerota archaeon]
MFDFSISKAPEFPPHFDWLNTDSKLSLSKLRGYVVVLDFWTYCCINCMHTLPTLARLERAYEGKPVVFIGVHSGKFLLEQETKNIQSAIIRYEIEHPVVVDQKMQIWQSFGVNAWPTIMVLDPSGNIVYHQSGEGQFDAISDTIDVLLQRHEQKGTLAKEPLHITTTKPQNSNILSFPGKISISKSGNIAISDSNHNRIIISDVSGKIAHIIGSGKPGLHDGDFTTAQFFRPQGVVWGSDDLFVADTENHAIRKIDLAQNKVVTLAGTGRPEPWRSLGGKGTRTSISSPWDIACDDGILYVAMAGNHQIWKYDIKSEMIIPYAGTGQENIVDGPVQSANLAQPSGLYLYGHMLYFADSEVSAVRKIDLIQNTITSIVGHGLFEFGHKDGNVDDALFQHPLGVCATKDTIFVADTYNSAIRVIDLKTNQVYTLIGKTEKQTVCLPDNPSCDILPLYEPSDIELFSGKLYIADTNNHLIRVFDLSNNSLDVLDLK